MTIKDIMTPAPRSCSRGTNLATAAALMLDGDCGILPVVDDGQLIGVVTDRDLFIALGTRNRLASDLTVGEVVQGPAITCNPDDDVRQVLQVMKDHRVRRLPAQGSVEPCWASCR
jgi:CBS domain-containing protein